MVVGQRLPELDISFSAGLVVSKETTNLQRPEV